MSIRGPYGAHDGGCRDVARYVVRELEDLYRRGEISRRGFEKARDEALELWHQRSRDGLPPSLGPHSDFMVDHLHIDGKRYAIRVPLSMQHWPDKADHVQIRRPPDFTPSAPVGAAKPAAPTPQRKLLLLTEKA